MSAEKKTAYLISCSDHYGHRLKMADAYLSGCGYETVYITSNFDHTSKQVFTCRVPGCVQIPARPYRKNLSVDRILSHMFFARDVFSYLEKLPQEPNVVVVLLPPNFLGHYAAKYKGKHPSVKLIFDIFDLWPETFPSGKAKKLLAPVFSVWAWIRNHSLPAADFIMTECELFRRRLGLKDENSATVYLCAEPLSCKAAEPQLKEDRLDICYQGAINNINDIPPICGLLGRLAEKKPVTLHIIGKGEREQEFIDSAKAAGAEVVFYGAVYDDAKKQQIMSKCHFGLNIMKSSVCVGLTMKSIEYFRHGLPIINSIPADTQELVEDGAGVQLQEGCAETLLALRNKDYVAMRQSVDRLIQTKLRKDRILAQYDVILAQVLKQVEP